MGLRAKYHHRGHDHHHHVDNLIIFDSERTHSQWRVGDDLGPACERLACRCGFCQGVLVSAPVTEEGWVFVCQACGRETVLSDAMIQLVGES